MEISFSKYQGTGNDFIIIDNRNSFFPKKNFRLVSLLCNRKFGIGADGLILLENKKGFDFNMVYFNSNGKPGSMCGNGGRCIVAFAKKSGILKNNYQFSASDGPHEGFISSFDEKKENCIVSLKMRDVNNIKKNKDHFILNTGSPHYVKFVKNLQAFDVQKEAVKIRYNRIFSEKGINVNFIEVIKNNIFIRTYERGVENETLSCGTGMTAAAICSSLSEDFKPVINKKIISLGGETKIEFKRTKKDFFFDIRLVGPANFVFSGKIRI